MDEHEFLLTYSEKGKITEGDLDRLVLATDANTADSAAWVVARWTRPRWFRGMWALSTTSLVAYRGRHGLTKKESQGVGSSSQDDKPGPGDGLPTISQGATGAAAEDIVVKRLHALTDKYSLRDGRRFYTSCKGTQLMDVSKVPITACRLCNKGSCGAQRHWFFECPVFE